MNSKVIHNGLIKSKSYRIKNQKKINKKEVN